MDLFLLVILILFNGVFAMSEIALVSARDTRLQHLLNKGKRGARSALALKNNPANFLSTVQVGITMVGILSGAIGEKTLAVPLEAWLATVPVLQPYANPLALAVVVVTLTFFSVVVGELVPKHLGLLYPERIAMLVARPMKMLARVAKPLVWVLVTVSNQVLRLFGPVNHKHSPITNEEIRLLMKQGAEAGIFHKSEQALVANVLRLDEQPVVAIMTHRQDIYVLDITKPEAEIRVLLAACPFSRIIVCRGGLENIAGLLRTADLMEAALACAPLDLERHLRPPLYVPEFVTTTQLLEHFRRAQLRCALVVDEYGDIQGFVTLTDVLSSIVGEVPSPQYEEAHECIRRDDGSWLIDGGVAIDRVKMTLRLTQDFPREKSSLYHTLGGFMSYMLGRIPRETDRVVVQGYIFEVIDMDNNRVDKILISRSPEE
jgi:putative hemolysin